jgi:curved DNA-binding protein CbpA
LKKTNEYRIINSNNKITSGYLMTSLIGLNYYEILGVSSTASDSEIRIAYKKKALKCHPDKASQNCLTVERATEVFKQVQEAHETLSNPQKRKLYDSKINILPRMPASFNTTHGFGSSYGSQRKSEDDYEETFFPGKINQDINVIIDGDSSEILDQFLKSNPFENSLLKSIFYSACRKGKFNIVRYLIEVRRLSPNLKVDDGLFCTGPIFKTAAESGNLALVKYLLEVHHVDIESQGLSAGTRDTALSRAASKGHADVVEYLISKGANLNPEVSNSDILNQAIDSKKISVVMLLVEAGTKIGSFNLGKALERGSLDIVQYLLQKKPDIKAHQYTSSPACMAVKSGNVALVKYLEEKEGLDLLEKHQSWDDSIALLMVAAAESGSVEMMRFLLDERGLNEKVMGNPKYIKSILSEAVGHKKCLRTKGETQEALKFVKFLMEERKFVLAKEKLEWLITDCVQFSGIEINSYLQSYLYDSDPSKKDVLLAIANQGLEIFNLADLFKLYNSKLIKKGKYADFSFEVHCHIKERKISIERLRECFLENRQMMVDALFYYLSYYHKDDLSALQLLLELGVDLNSEDAKGVPAIHAALQSGGRNKIVQFFIDNKADLSKKDKHGRTAAEILR